jgi:hypothetical protein
MKQDKPTTRVLIPMLGRAHLVEPLVDNLRSTGEIPVLFLCSPDDHDVIVECNRTQEDVIVVDWVPGRADYAKKINLGYRETTEAWVFTGASDLVFYPHWDSIALMVGARVSAGVVGTQDKGNPYVKRGLQSTHSLVSRDYISEFGGATFDKTGVVYSEAYDHQYIDIELVETAKLRKRWAFAKRSIVEHRHPAWDTAPLDKTYEKAWRESIQDHQLYQRRMARFRTIHARNAKRAKRRAPAR